MKAAGFDTATQLARAAGLHPGNVLKWIEGDSTPSVEGLRKIAPLVGVRPGDLMLRAYDMNRDELSVTASPAPLRPVLRSAQARFDSRKLTDHQKGALERHLQRALDMFDELVEPPTEPPLRRR